MPKEVRLGPSGERLGTSWERFGLPETSRNRSKIEAKINQFLNASWDRIFEGCWWILEAPSWQQKSIPTSNGDCLKKTSVFTKEKPMVLKDLGVLKIKNILMLESRGL